MPLKRKIPESTKWSQQGPNYKIALFIKFFFADVEEYQGINCGPVNLIFFQKYMPSKVRI